MKNLAIAAVRMSRWLLSFAGRGGSLPGQIGLRLDPRILSRLQIDGPVIVVTGTNGKTSTANLIADLLKRLIQNLRLGNRPGESIQHITVPAVRSGHPVKKNFYSKLIRHQKPLIHIFLGFHPQLRAVFNV